jgi:hypothetical protein
LGHGDDGEKGMKPSTEIDTDLLAREAKASEHGEAYQQMGRLNGIGLGVGARETSRGEPEYFIECLIPICPDSEVDLGRMAWILEVLRGLEEGGYSLTCQDDMTFSCELTTRGEKLEGEYDRAISMLAQS